MALAWLKAKGVVPILGARTLEQLQGNLKAADVVLTEEQVAQLDKASTVSLGYPHDFNNAPENREVLTGGRAAHILKPQAAVG